MHATICDGMGIRLKRPARLDFYDFGCYTQTSGVATFKRTFGGRIPPGAVS